MKRNWPLSWLLIGSACMTLSACGPQAPDALQQGACTAERGCLAQALNGPPPQLTQVSPNLGSATGGATVVITGKYFQPGIRVLFNGVPCSSVSLLSSTQVSVYLPASPGARGLVPVQLSQPDGKSVTRSDLFYYYSDSIAWQPAYQYGPALRVRSFVLGDVNRDGKLDAIVTDNVHGNVAVLLGNSDGSFAPPKLTPVVEAPDSLVTADLNGDGKLDVVVEGERSPDFNVLLGNGDGTFVVSKVSSIVANAHGLATGDFNGDGKTDLAYAGSSGPVATGILLGNGDGTFQRPRALTPSGLLGNIATWEVNAN